MMQENETKSTVATRQRVEAQAASLPPQLAYLVFIGIVFIWGLNWPIMKIATGMIAPLWFVFLRFTLGAACLLVVVIGSGRFAWPDRRDLPIMITMPIFQMGLYLSLINVGLLYVPAGRAAILAYTTPIWVMPLARLLLKEHLGRLKIIACLIGLLGIVILVNPASIDWGNSRVLFGNAALLLAAASWAIAILHSRSHRWHLTPLQLAPLQMLLVIPVIGGIAWLQNGPLTVTWSPRFVLILLFNGPLATAFTFWAILSVQRALPASTTALSFLAVPVWGLVASTWWLGEDLPISLLIGGILILGSVALVWLADRRGRRAGRDDR
jgi:drug/metabolite transporter (DMT)-like permease